MTEKQSKQVDVDIDFDLPVLEDGPKAVRVHRGPGESTCTSCEG